MKDFIESYDHMILAPVNRELYGHSGFYNVGDWSKEPETLGTACNHLVDRHLDLVSDLLNPVKILDAGCGLGSSSAVIAGRFGGEGLIAINISEQQIAYARQQQPAICFQVMDATRMAFPDDCFDLIICVEAVFHFNTRAAFLENAFRILRPGGQLVFSDILFHNTHWVGSWSVPAVNLVTDLAIYRHSCTKSGFRIAHLEDITDSSVKGFCQHLRQTGMHTLADGFEASILAYLLVSLQKMSFLSGGRVS